LRFRIIVVAILGSIDAYLVWSLGLSVWGAAILSLAFVSILWLPFVFWRADRPDDAATSRSELAMQWLAFGSMGFLSFLWMGTLLRDLISLFMRAPLHTPEVRGWIFAFAAVAYAVGMVNALRGPRLRQVEVAIMGLPQEVDGLRIVQLSDLHVGPTIRERMIQRMAAKAREAKPDLLVITGDAVDGTVPELSRLLKPLSEIPAPRGKFYVPGNHEYYWGAAPWVEYFGKLGFHTLLNSHEIIRCGNSQLLIAGVGDPAARRVQSQKVEGPNLEKALRGAPDDIWPRVLLAHHPGIAPEAEKAGFQLQLSGHTHGGQFFPWTLVAYWVHRIPHGLRLVGGLWVYVSRGTGYWGPPVRLGSPSEVSLLILRSQAKIALK